MISICCATQATRLSPLKLSLIDNGLGLSAYCFCLFLICVFASVSNVCCCKMLGRTSDNHISEKRFFSSDCKQFSCLPFVLRAYTENRVKMIRIITKLLLLHSLPIGIPQYCTMSSPTATPPSSALSIILAT
jgi:hypothetical protein